ncbi:MAG TPA: DUF3576 domain-containing protein [Hellea balneolensis]|uniref:DUF3576 domain-containing protein n=1 Tax=Hellea balneolensis TaxID=287478 RepID=A0A7V5NWQ1_9PROT|nr:DUF3576 domain-containing protein [Hellea balneolensis]
MSSVLTKIVITGVLALGMGSGLGGCGTVKKILPGGKSKVQAKGGTHVKARKAAPRMGVNEFLWRASLETLNFMPLKEVDPFGGVILTDWYANPQVPNERFKANVYILDTNLRADALKVSIFKQVNDGSGWRDANVDGDTSRTIENSILTRARELYIASVDNR